MIKELILATSNSGKIKELQDLLAPLPCIPQTVFGIDSAEETGLSFIENALLKARHASSLTDKPALADDSGLVVPALNGEPGIFSARYAGLNASDADNIQLLLHKMREIPENQRHAYFYCALALVQHPNDPTPIVCTGILHGSITMRASGEQGFGYDPLFYVAEHQGTLAQLPASIKNKISHRAIALNQLRHLIADL